MSDFDKEAEREKLREKYERDQEKRQSTQRMSELLLKGATMTNRHCEECGDPIFRYDGQEFCPTCQHAAQQGDAPASTGTGAETNDGSDAETSDEPGAETNDEISVETSASDATVEANGAPEPASADVDADGVKSEAKGVPERPQDETNQGRERTNRNRDETRSTVRDVGRGSTDAVEQEGDLAAARASLVRSVERYARAAEQTDDPRRAKDHLAAAREAAEALDALDR